MNLKNNLNIKISSELKMADKGENKEEEGGLYMIECFSSIKVMFIIFVEVEMSEESEIMDDYDAIVDVSDIDDVDTNVDDLDDVDKLLVTTKEESTL